MGDSVSSRKSEIFCQIFHHVFHDIISGENEKAERMEREEEREGERKRQTSQEIKRKNPMKGGPPRPTKPLGSSSVVHLVKDRVPHGRFDVCA